MSSNNDSSDVIGTLAGMALMYWLAIGLLGAIIVALAGILIAIALGIALLYGVIIYFMEAADAIASKDERGILNLVIAPMLAPIGVFVGLFITEGMGTGSYVSYLSTASEANYEYEGLLVLLWLVVGSYLAYGWAIAGYSSYQRTDPWKSISLWFTWGLACALMLGWSGLDELSRSVA